MFVTAAPCRSPICVMWYSDGPGNELNCHSKSEPQKLAALLRVVSRNLDVHDLTCHQPLLSCSPWRVCSRRSPGRPPARSKIIGALAPREVVRAACGRSSSAQIPRSRGRLEIEEADLPVDGGPPSGSGSHHSRPN